MGGRGADGVVTSSGGSTSGRAGDRDAAPADLVEAAWRAYRNAYVPYSQFPVGAALRGESGRIYAGANVENASYGLGRCAEQSAIQALATDGERSFLEAVVVSGADEPASPCGACRQILFEFSPDASMWLLNEDGQERRFTVRQLLPHAFSL